MYFSPLPVPPAYLDPGSGSLIIQMIIAAVIGGGLLLRSFWGKLTGKSKKNEDEMDESTKDERD
jgi:hypothetical protein